MKFTVDGYEIEIKAKNLGWGDKRYNKAATMSFMNMVSVWMDSAAAYDAFEHKNGSGWYTNKPDAIEVSRRCAERLADKSRELYKQLEEYGCYDDQE